MIGELLESMMFDIVSTFIVIPVITLGVLFVVRRLPNERIWAVRRGFTGLFRPDRRPPTTVVSTSFQDTGNYRRPQTGIGQVRAIAVLTPSIARAYSAPMDHARLRMSHGCRLQDEAFAGDLLLIGGPKTNEVTAKVLELIQGFLPAGFEFRSVPENGTTVDAIFWNGVRQLPHDNRFPGVLIRCNNPLGEAASVLTIVAGIATFGTEGAALALVNDHRIRGSWWHPPRQRGFVALTAASVLNPTDEVPRLLPPRIEDLIEMPWRAP